MFFKYRIFNLIIFFIISSQISFAQSFAPPVGHAGTTAIYKDSSVFVNWVNSCQVQRGYQDISNPSTGFASVGDASLVIGAPDVDVVSLGDGGSATCSFPYLIENGPGYDFAVFENGFDDTFLELAFVEVSSDGIHFFRFPSHSLTDTVTQTNSFGPTDATKINNLAGKYRGEYGTPFDLQELANIQGLDINAIVNIKVIDVVGSVNSLYATRDSYNNKVNDPWPTAFASGGFDLDAIGVMHQSTMTNIRENELNALITVFPNPVNKNGALHISMSPELISAELMDVSGTVMKTSHIQQLDCEALAEGIYFLRIKTTKGVLTKKICIQ